MSKDLNAALDALDPPTLRDQFAMAALAGIVASEAFSGPLWQQSPKAAADFAYQAADAMVAERKRVVPAGEDLQ